MRRVPALAAAVLASLAVGFAPAVPDDAVAPVPDDAAPAVPDDAVAAPPIGPLAASTTTADRTMVVLADDVADPTATTRRLVGLLGVGPVHRYGHALHGFAVALDRDRVVRAIGEDPAVAVVEADRAVRTAQTTPTGVRRVDAVAAASIGSGRTVPVDIAVLDTGIASHRDLRVVERLDCTDTVIEPTVEYVEYLLLGSCKQGGTDRDGHGTHVAGIAGARDDGRDVVGVAPGARLWAIKVIESTDGGRLSDVIAGLDEVARRAPTIEVANISLVADGRSSAMDAAVDGAVDAGVVVVVAAGNGSEDARDTTPANSPGAITVSAVTDLDGRPGGARSGACHGRDDRFATYSNHGSVVDLAAPGSCIVSTARTGGTAVLSGTSMAAPHVAGAAALRIHQRSLAAGPSRASTVLSDLRSTAAAENSTCGYRGSPSDEPLLDLRRGC